MTHSFKGSDHAFQKDPNQPFVLRRSSKPRRLLALLARSDSCGGKFQDERLVMVQIMFQHISPESP